MTNGVWSEEAYDAVTLVGLVGIPAKESIIRKFKVGQVLGS